MPLIQRLRAAALGTAWILPSIGAAAEPRIIEVVADKDNVFKMPGLNRAVLVVKAGEAVKLRITSRAGPERARDGAVHSFVIRKLRDQGWDLRLMEGTQEFRLTAPARPGEYVVECTVKCGHGHEDMKMKLIVQR
jgi:heme/copper-type cytochrome/quinol oxidase subunit 2